MALRFTVLGSGSSGNATLLQAGNFGLLLDAGLGPRQLATRMHIVGATWEHVHAVILTHTHGDHWNERTLAHLRRRHIPFYCHPDHHTALALNGWEFAKLRTEKLVRGYDPGKDLHLTPSFSCRPISVRHDGGATFGFRFQVTAPGNDGCLALGYVADLGCWTEDLADFLANVDLLAVEFNHDVELEYSSGRSPQLIARILGDEGHLSNDQAAELLAEVLRRSTPGRLQHVVQLHLSRDCNRPLLASQVARALLADLAWEVQVHTACQERPGPCLDLSVFSGALLRSGVTPRSPRHPSPEHNGIQQGWLPGWEF